VGGWIAVQPDSATVGASIVSETTHGPPSQSALPSIASAVVQPPSHPGGASKGVCTVLEPTVAHVLEFAVNVVGKVHPPSGWAHPHCPHGSGPASRSMAPW
jgi:hypothetical protein